MKFEYNMKTSTFRAFFSNWFHPLQLNPFLVSWLVCAPRMITMHRKFWVYVCFLPSAPPTCVHRKRGPIYLQTPTLLSLPQCTAAPLPPPPSFPPVLFCCNGCDLSEGGCGRWWCYAYCTVELAFLLYLTSPFLTTSMRRWLCVGVGGMFSSSLSSSITTSIDQTSKDRSIL